MNRIVLVAAVAVTAAACSGKKAGAPPAKGPPPAWRSSIDPELYEAIAAAPDTLVTVADAGLTAYRDGKVAWTTKLPAAGRGVLVALDPQTVLAADDAGNLHAIAVADGTILWSAPTPVAEDASDATDHSPIHEVAVADRTVVALD